MTGLMPILAIFAMACRCGSEPPLAPVVAEHPRHVVVISMDTVRADALGTHGGPAQTPNIDKFASTAVVFENHMSAAPSTLSSHTSLMTGQYPHKHGIPRNAHRIDDANVMLAEVLDAAGFETAAFLGAMPLGEHANFLQGFDHVDADFRRPRETRVYEQAERSGDLVTDAALGWLETAPDERLFLFVHYFDAHQPYESTDDETSGSMKSVYRLRRQLGEGKPAAAALSEALKPLYWAEIASVDREVGRLLDGLRSKGIADDALIVLTADHGESYAEHGEYWDHGNRVYDQTVHTPLMIKSPETTARRIAPPVSAVDVFPTVVDVLRLAPMDVDGRSLVPILKGGEIPLRPVFSEATKPWEKNKPWRNANREKSVRLGDLKMVWDPKTDRRELYDVVADPSLSNDLAGIPEHARLVAAMDAWIAEAEPLPSKKVNAPNITEQLEALGYVD